jgi:hypothetical protein
MITARRRRRDPPHRLAWEGSAAPAHFFYCEPFHTSSSAGELNRDGYEATTHWAFVRCLTERFPKVKVVAGHPRYCLDRNRLTGGGISSGLDEALELIQLLKGTSARRPAAASSSAPSQTDAT